MLCRQRTILALLADAGGSATRLEVTKWAFLLREETPSRGGQAFFQFLPYKYGPFSFCLYHEALALVRDGYLREIDERRWALQPLGAEAAACLDRAVRKDVSRVASRFAGKSTDDLLEYVYSHYQWFTINSVKDVRAQRTQAASAVYTAGYEGLSVDGFLNELLRAGIRLLVDVRNNPVSRRYGFHASTLHRLCDGIGIEYRHFPELGIEPEQRQHLDSQTAWSALFSHYERSILPAQGDSVRQVAALLAGKPGALICMEADYRRCHRSRLASTVSKASGLPTKHLELAR